MDLSSDLISQFVQITKEEKQSKETTVYGTIVEYNGGKYVKLDGSELLTPISATADAIDGERVTVMIKNHTALVTGNISSPSARTNTVKDIDKKVDDIGNKISEFEIIIADKVSVERLEAEIARIDTLVSENVTIKGRLDANEAEIKNLIAEDVTITGRLDANEASIENLKTTKLDAEVADIKYATIENLEATNASVHNLEADYGEFKSLSTDKFSAVDADIENLKATKISAKDIEGKYANIDFSNIGKAAIEAFYSKSGLIENIVVGDGTITGTLVGVTIKGDLIEGGTIVADKLVIQGDDGLYYKLNTNGKTVSSEQTEYNSLNGSIITAKSITATQISVSDLVAFDATIGGFNITDSSIYSGVKESVDNTTRGLYFDKTGQLNIGDATNFLKYYKDPIDGLYKLEISAGSIKMSATNETVEEAIGNAIVQSVEQFYQSTSPVSLDGGSWSETQPTWTEGTYIWRRTAITYGNGSSEYTPSETGVCITGNTGAAGKGISKTEVYYYLSTSNTTQTGGSWSTSVPEWVDGRYYWQKIKSTYTDGTTSESTPVCITGAKGDTGSTGTGVASITAEFYLSTSKTSQIGGSWSTTMPTWSSGKYLWTRNKIVYKNPTSTVYTTPVCDSSWEAVNEIEIGGRNLLKPLCTAGNGTSNVDRYSIEIIGGASDACFYANLYDPLDVNQEYTLSYEINYDGELSIQDWYFYVGLEGSEYTIPITRGKQSITFVPSSSWDLTRLTLDDNDIGETNDVVIKISKLMLERGNKATDWTPAPEDVEDSIIKSGDELRTTIVDQRTDIINDCEQIILSALQQYVETSDYEEFKTTVSSQLSIMADEIKMNFEKSTSSIEKIDGDVQSKFTQLYKYISFSGDTAITIGSGDGSLTLELDNEKGIVFSKNGVAFGTWDGNNFYTGNIVVRLNERAQFGNFAFIPRSDGSLSFLKVGE